MKIVHHIQSEETLKLLGDPTRLEIVRILIAKQATISQLGAALKIHPARVRNHIKQLERQGLVELVSIKPDKNYIEKYYRATASMFLLNMAVLPEPPDHNQLILLASDDPALNLLVKKVNEKMNRQHIYALPVGSLNALIYLKENYSNIAGCHLIDISSGEYNIPYVHLLFSDQNMVLIHLVKRQQGLLVEKGNPKNISGLRDLSRDDVVFINRKRGSGTRLWIDQNLKNLELRPGTIHYHYPDASTHAEVAETVKNGIATTGVAVFSAAKRFDLDFIPLFEEQYDLVMTDDIYSSCQFQPLIEMMQSQEFQEEVIRLGGYNVDQIGDHIHI